MTIMRKVLFGALILSVLVNVVVWAVPLIWEICHRLPEVVKTSTEPGVAPEPPPPLLTVDDWKLATVEPDPYIPPPPPPPWTVRDIPPVIIGLWLLLELLNLVALVLAKVNNHRAMEEQRSWALDFFPIERIRGVVVVFLIAYVSLTALLPAMASAFGVSSLGSTPDPFFTALPGWLLGGWIFFEFFRVLLMGGCIAEILVVAIVIAVMASVAGPMIGSITDQGRGSALKSRISNDMADSRAMGYAVGGAKDVGNFRQNIRQGLLPLLTDLTFEGLFYDYSFETGTSTPGADSDPKAGQRLFSPSYNCAVSPNPLTGETEYFLSVGLNSNLTEASFKRKDLNLVVVLDISGSMESGFDEYYYDRTRRSSGITLPEDLNAGLSKIRIACRSIAALTNHLRAGDRFGMVLYDQESYLAKPLSRVDYTDMTAIRRHIEEIQTGGSTNMEAGLRQAGGLLEELGRVDPHRYENRIIFLTDAMPNTADHSDKGLLGITRGLSQKGIYTTFVGVGLDFNSTLIDRITKIRGANYYSVHTSKEFTQRMNDEFDLMVTPLVFDLCLNLQTKGWTIEKVYGSPEANETTGELMRVNTLFPSKTTDEGTRGGIVLLKLTPGPEADEIKLRVSYEDRAGTKESCESRITFPTAGSGAATEETFDHSGIRKGVLLSRYGELIHDWIVRERGLVVGKTEQERRRLNLGPQERTSMPLRVTPETRARFRSFLSYFQRERQILGDATLDQESTLLADLIARADKG